MSDRDDRSERERAFSLLFDRSANAPSEETRERLGKHAAALGKRSVTPLRYTWVPALAAAAALAYLVIPGRHPAVRTADSAVTSASRPPIAEVPNVAPPEAPPSEAPEAEDPVASVLGGDPADLEPFDLGPLMGSPSPHRDDGNVAGRRGINDVTTVTNRQVERKTP